MCINKQLQSYSINKSTTCLRCRLHSSDVSTCVVPYTQTSFGDRAFQVAGPKLLTVCRPHCGSPTWQSVEFKSLLKTHLFAWDCGTLWFVFTAQCLNVYTLHIDAYNKRRWESTLSSWRLVTLNECSCTILSSRYSCWRWSSNITSSSVSCRRDCFCLDDSLSSWWCRENSSILFDGRCWSGGSWCYHAQTLHSTIATFAASKTTIIAASRNFYN